MFDGYDSFDTMAVLSLYAHNDWLLCLSALLQAVLYCFEMTDVGYFLLMGWDPFFEFFCGV